jgi:hypothetical protein
LAHSSCIARLKAGSAPMSRACRVCFDGPLPAAPPGKCTVLLRWFDGPAVSGDLALGKRLLQPGDADLGDLRLAQVEMLQVGQAFQRPNGEVGQGRARLR